MGIFTMLLRLFMSGGAPEIVLTANGLGRPKRLHSEVRRLSVFCVDYRIHKMLNI